MNNLKCSNCGLVNFATAINCQRCQTTFVSQAQSTAQFNTPQTEFASNHYRPPMSPRNVEAANDSIWENGGFRRMIYGCLWLAGGVGATLFTYSSAAPSGGRYYVFYGAIIFGVFDIIRGIAGMFAGD